jgi:hypothetical protein
MNLVRRLLSLLLTRRYQATDHALEGLDDDQLSFADVLACLVSGRVRRSWPRQRKYEVEGRAVDGRRVRVIVRLLPGPRVRIITVYEVY